jgi:excisionase family DNA binding protein
MTKVVVDMDEVYDVDEAATLLGKGVATIWRRIRDKKIIVVHIAGRTLIPKSEIERFKNEQAAQGN